MLEVVVLTLTLFLSNNAATSRSSITSDITLEECEARKSEAIAGLTGQDVTVPGGDKVSIRYVDGFCRKVIEGHNA